MFTPFFFRAKSPFTFRCPRCKLPTEHELRPGQHRACENCDSPMILTVAEDGRIALSGPIKKSVQKRGHFECPGCGKPVKPTGRILCIHCYFDVASTMMVEQ